jgi:hypothetical protein
VEHWLVQKANPSKQGLKPKMRFGINEKAPMFKGKSQETGIERQEALFYAY